MRNISKILVLLLVMVLVSGVSAFAQKKITGLPA